ncbi:hypothetical protein BOTBODRAFT_191399 [Botryobasidium botryosum FD-172 SS1]|uniref:Fe2OG dioxygenase domain-containing protein n=1 Tax=Botryobasidium botryosum (strain FD-172 SS1) TaxID=930990 RepID=A0A067MAQ0_BOTB1|nr:hypothetical protein BOTBODRAFT_191399 [Botryobasidium botryosum FD-172 SS1]
MDPYRIAASPGTAYYVPDFVSPQEEEYLIRKIQESPQPKWKNLANRRLQVWGGDVKSGSNVLLKAALPSFLTEYPDIIPRLRSTGVFSNTKQGAPNHVIVNEYLPGQGIMPHEDGPSYHPVVATISLGSHAVFNYYRYKAPPPEEEIDEDEASRTSRGRAIHPDPVFSIFLEPRSLIITTSSLYTDHLHGIDPLEEDIFASALTSPPSSDTTEDSDLDAEKHRGIRVVNWEQIKDEETRRVLEEGGSLKRGTRVSLTCRVVERELGVGVGGLKGMRLQGKKI